MYVDIQHPSHIQIIIMRIQMSSQLKYYSLLTNEPFLFNIIETRKKYLRSLTKFVSLKL